MTERTTNEENYANLVGNQINYRGQSYPIDLDRGLVGTLTDEEIEKYSKGVNRGINYGDGDHNNIYFEENHAIRSSTYHSPQSIDICLKNFLIGNDLRINGLNAPKMFGIYFGKESNTPFLVMQRKKLISPSNLDRNIRVRLHEEIKQEFTKIRLMGYQPSDHYWNFRFDPEDGKGVFFDFDKWESEHFIPQLNEQERVYFGEKILKPFLVMEKLNLKKIGFLNVNEKRILFNDYYNGLEKIQGLGYNNISNDTSIRRNFEFDIIKKSGVFFDFDDWKSEHFIPQLNEKGELITQNPVRMFSRNPQRNKQEGELIR